MNRLEDALRGARVRWVLLAVAASVLAGCGGQPAAERPDETSEQSRPPDHPGSADPTRSAEGLPAPDRTPAGTLLVADFGGDTVTFIDPEHGAFDSVEVGTAPYGLALGDDGRAWAATAEGVAVVDTAARERLTLIPYRTDGLGTPAHGEYRGGGMGIALAPDGDHLYVGVNRPGGNGTVEVIDTRTLKVTGSAEVGRRPFDIDISADGKEVYATNHDSFDVTVVTAGSLATRRLEAAPYGSDGGLGSWLKPHHSVVRPSDGKLLLPFEGEKLLVLDPETGSSEVEPMTANTHQHGAAITADGRLLVVGTGPIDPASDQGASLTVRDSQGEERVIALEGAHEEVAVSRDGRTAFVTGGFTRDGYWDGVSVVDLENETVRRLAGGERPVGIVVL